ncbi:MAG: FkbM family methyltransferase, partial [Chlorobiaceae bacterium]|nr:FkbM family methyltransferase [Chlorobiaceae bacterium]
NGFENFGTIYSTKEIQTKKLDDVYDIPQIDMLKMDIQGSELSVLENGIEKLKDCLSIQLEVSYVCLYENQPTYGEIDLWMRKHGYLPHCFVDIKRWSISPTIINNDFRIAGNQLLESDIIYIKDPLNAKNLTISQLKKLCLISHYCFSSFDLCVYLLLELCSRNCLDNNTHMKYLEIINSKSH